MNKTALSPLESLAQTLRNKEGHVISVDIASIVNGKPLSSYQTYTAITSALLAEFDGCYNTKSGLYGNSLLDDRGIVLNLGEYSQLFIDESAKIEEISPNDELTIVNIKDIRSSMHIKLQIFNSLEIPYEK